MSSPLGALSFSLPCSFPTSALLLEAPARARLSCFLLVRLDFCFSRWAIVSSSIGLNTVQPAAGVHRHASFTNHQPPHHRAAVVPSFLHRSCTVLLSLSAPSLLLALCMSISRAQRPNFNPTTPTRLPRIVLHNPLFPFKHIQLDSRFGAGTICVSVSCHMSS